MIVRMRKRKFGEVECAECSTILKNVYQGYSQDLKGGGGGGGGVSTIKEGLGACLP